MKRQFAFIAGLAALLAWAPAQAQELKFATQNPQGHPLVTGMEKFAEIVAAKSGGKLKVKLFPGGVLGGDQANVSALQGGTLEVVVLNSGILASQVKEFGVYDFAGLKLRVIPNVINVDWVKALGANPTPLPFPEVYAALDQKAIDGQENPPTVISANKLYDVQKHIVLSNHPYNPQSLIFSKKVWDTLSAADRKILADAGVEAGKYQRQVSRDAATTALENLKKNGMQVTELSAAELAKFREAMKPV